MPRNARLARIAFNWRDPSQKISKAVAPRDTKQLFRWKILSKVVALPTEGENWKSAL